MPRAQFTKIEVARILALHRDGLSNKFIAERLGLRADPAGISRICRAIKRAECPDREGGGPCVFTPDVEYDTTGKTINCEHCGRTPTRRTR